MQALAWNTDMCKQFERIEASIFASVKNLFNIAKIDQSFGARCTRQVGDKGKFFNKPWTVTIDHSIFFGMKTATVASRITVAAIRQTCGIAIVSDREYLAKVGACDDSSHMQPHTSRPASKAKGQIHIDFFKTRSHGAYPQ